MHFICENSNTFLSIDVLLVRMFAYINYLIPNSISFLFDSFFRESLQDLIEQLLIYYNDKKRQYRL